MYLLSINKFNNVQPTFGKAYLSKKAAFNETQKKLAENIVSAMKTPTDIYNNKSSEEFYEAKGFDFIVTSSDKHDTVNLVARKKDNREHFIVDSYNNKEQYNNNSLKRGFQLYETQKALEHKDNIISAIIDFTTLAAAVAGVILLLSFVLRRPNITQEKPLIENVNNISNSIKSPFIT